MTRTRQHIANIAICAAIAIAFFVAEIAILSTGKFWP